MKRQEEIDLVALDDDNALFCECKYTEEPFDEKQLQDLKSSAACIPRKNNHFMIFSKNGITSGVQKELQELSNYFVVDLQKLFE